MKRLITLETGQVMWEDETGYRYPAMCGEVFHEFADGATTCLCGRDEWQENHLDEEEAN